MSPPSLIPALFLSAFLIPCAPAEAPKGICINEISAVGYGHDWVELYNASGETIDDLPLVLRDSLDDSGNRFPLCVSSLRPGERRIVTCPNLLNGNGEELALLDGDGNMLDAIAYDRQTFSLTYGRRRDGAPDWCFQLPSEGNPNGTVPEDASPIILGAPFHTPLSPAAGEPVSVSIAAVAAGELAGVEVLYRTDGEAAEGESPWMSAPCRDDGVDPDEVAADGRFTARLPGFPAGTALRYRILAVDRSGNEAFAPSADGAFGVRFGYVSPAIRINEILASNRAAGRYMYEDRYYESDWIELYNFGDSLVDLSKWSFSDRRTGAVTFPLLGGGRKFILPGGFLLVWAQRYIPEDLPDATGVNFSLSRNGEEIVLFAEDGFSVVDSVKYPPLATDRSYGRIPEGTGEFSILDVPTPRGGTVYPPRRVEVISYAPLLPQLGETVTVQVRVSRDLPVQTAQVYFWLMEEGRVPLRDDGTEGDETAGDGVYTGRIGPFQDSGVLHFSIEVKAQDGADYRDPERRADLYQIPFSWKPAGPLKINEVFAGCYLCCRRCLAFRSLGGPLEPLNYVEIRNAGDTPQDLKGLFLTDDPLNPTKFPIDPPKNAKLPPGGCHAVWFSAGDETKVLDPAGGTLFLLNEAKTLDAIVYGGALPGKSYGYLPQESAAWILGEPSPGAPNGSPFFVRGDADGDLHLNLIDAIVVVRAIFMSQEADCPDALDADDSGSLDITDAIALLAYLFQGGSRPPTPFPASGPDGTQDSLDCLTS